MKTLILTTISLFLLLSTPVQAYNDKNVYNDFLAESQKYEYDNFSIKDDSVNVTNFYKKLCKSIKNTIRLCFNNYIKVIFYFFIVCLISAMANSLVTTDSLKNIIDNTISLLLCMIIILPLFKNTIRLGIGVLCNLNEYMNFSLPGITILLSSSGYSSTAYTINTTYIFFSNIISIIINKALSPVLYFLAAIILLSIIGDHAGIEKFIKSTIKFLKYFIGFILTLFSAILTLSGLTSSASDTLAIKTAKYAISNFVPIVGNCLSETLNNIIYSSSLLKNSVGFLGVVTIIIIAAAPLIELFLKTFFIKLLSIIASAMSNEKLSNVLEMMSELLTFVFSLTLFMTVCFIILIGIIASIGG